MRRITEDLADVLWEAMEKLSDEQLRKVQEECAWMTTRNCSWVAYGFREGFCDISIDMLHDSGKLQKPMRENEMELTEEQLAILPERVRKAYLKILAMSDPDMRESLMYFCTELAHALEQVAAAKLMAEAAELCAVALQAESNYYGRKFDGGDITSERRSRLFRRYWYLMNEAKKQALAAWKAVQDES